MKSNLNAKQQEASTYIQGPLLIVAGAGTGKTKTLTHRIAYLIEQGVNPENILAVTFTNKAAQEMRNRVHELLAHTTKKDIDEDGFLSRSREPLVSTFHSLGVRILKEAGSHINIPRHFTILDKSGQLSIIKRILKAKGFDPKEFPPEKILRTISKNKSELISQDTFRSSAKGYPFSTMVSTLWAEYEQELKKQNALDFDDLITKTVFLLKKHENIRKHYLAQWLYIHIDEYQDTNKAQYELAHCLVGKEKNICVVGDADQLIYEWRGANINNILHFEDDYSGAKTVILEENYRSTQRILNAANDIIKKNKKRKKKNLFTQNIEGDKIALYEALTEGLEAQFVASKTADLISSGARPQDIAVLYRANFQSRVLEEAFLTSNIPYQVLGVKFFDRKEVKDVLAFIRAGLNPESNHDIERVINVPTRGIGKVTLEKMRNKEEASLTPAMQARVEAFRAMLEKIGEAALTQPVSKLIKTVLSVSGLEKALREGNEEDKERLENIQELATLAKKYDVLPPEEAVEHFLTDAALASDQDSLEKKEDSVRLMTVHASKGLEFPYVFITGLEAELFPHQRMGEKMTEAKAEEERRLFYVAITRAKKKIFLSYASIRTIFGQEHINIPSEFIADIEEHLESEDGGDTGADGEGFVRELLPSINF